jgi:hypothetical protein
MEKSALNLPGIRNVFSAASSQSVGLYTCCVIQAGNTELSDLVTRIYFETIRRLRSR